MEHSGIPRESIPWFPTVKEENCDACGKCIEFCRYGVYEPGEAGKASVIAPYNCIVGCSYCSTDVCTKGVISFPSIEWLREFLREKRDNLVQQ